VTVDDQQWLTEHFQQHRPHLRAVAYRMLGSLADADDAVQDAWERVSRARADEVGNLTAWLTTIVARVCLNLLRSRTAQREESLEVSVPDPILTLEAGPIPNSRCCWPRGRPRPAGRDRHPGPAERLTFVLHDLFDLPFEEIAPLVGRTPEATRQLASRARRRVKAAETPSPEGDLARQRAVVDAFLAASRAGDFDALVAVLHPDVVVRADFSPSRPRRSAVTRGAAAVARQALQGARPAAQVHPALVNGSAGVVLTMDGRPYAVFAFTIAEGKIVQIDAVADPDRVARLAAAVLAGG
jgi:DNA-directed RNA polymerase specialized sigma24 family protein/ketosteroid isomerase-like protein